MVMSRSRFVARTRELIEAGERIIAEPGWDAFRGWLLDCDRFLEAVWGRMDRYHLAWLNVGRDPQPAGSPLDAAAERHFISAVVAAKLAVLRTMLTSVERGGWAPLSDDEAAEEEDR